MAAQFHTRPELQLGASWSGLSLEIDATTYSKFQNYDLGYPVPFSETHGLAIRQKYEVYCIRLPFMNETLCDDSMADMPVISSSSVVSECNHTLKSDNKEKVKRLSALMVGINDGTNLDSVPGQR